MWWLWVAPEKFSHALLQMIHVQLGVKFVNWATPQPVVLSVKRNVCVCVYVCVCEREREREREREKWGEGNRKRRHH